MYLYCQYEAAHTRNVLAFTPTVARGTQAAAQWDKKKGEKNIFILRQRTYSKTWVQCEHTLRIPSQSINQQQASKLTKQKRAWAAIPMFLQLHNHKLSPWERQRTGAGGRQSEWESIKWRQEERRKRRSLETQRRPQRLKKRRSGRQQPPPSLPSPPPLCQLCSAEGFHHLRFFWGDFLIWDASHQQLWILCRSQELRRIICKACELSNSLGCVAQLQNSG